MLFNFCCLQVRSPFSATFVEETSHRYQWVPASCVFSCAAVFLWQTQNCFCIPSLPGWEFTDTSEATFRRKAVHLWIMWQRVRYILILLLCHFVFLSKFAASGSDCNWVHIPVIIQTYILLIQTLFPNLNLCFPASLRQETFTVTKWSTLGRNHICVTHVVEVSACSLSKPL